MNIGFLATSLSRNAGGIYDATRALAKELNHFQDCAVTAFGLSDEHTGLDVAGWGTVPLITHAVLGPRAFGYSSRLAKAVNAWEGDLLHAHGLWGYPSIVSRNWARYSKKPNIISPHGMLDAWALKNSGLKKRIAGLAYESGHLQEASCIHALCEAEAKAIRSYGLRNPICVIPNGIDPVLAGGYGRRAAWRDKLPADSKILLYLGRIHPKKGLYELVQGWAYLYEQNSLPRDWHLVVAGWEQGDFRSRLESLVESKGLTGQIHFVGPQFNDDKVSTYRAADGFVLPSFSEGLPMVILEAWSYGLPVLMTPECNVPDGFAAEAAIEITPSLESLVKGLALFFSMSESDRSSMGRRGKTLVDAKFSWSTAATQMHKVYLWLLGGSRPDCVQVD